MTQADILRFAESYHYLIAKPSIMRAVHYLSDHELIDEVDGRFSITFRGREWCSGVRHYLLNSRI